MTIKELREAISNLLDDGGVYVQRIEDCYFEENLAALSITMRDLCRG